MQRTRLTCVLGMTVCATVTGHSALAQESFNPLGFYAGASIGETFVQGQHDNNFDNFDYGNDRFNRHDFAWKAVLGVRPLPIVGAELEYLDFGHPHDHSDGGFYGPFEDDHEKYRGPAAFAVGYIPIPLPFLDVYGKIGAAHLQSVVDSYYVPACGPGGQCSNQVTVFHSSRQTTTLAYGAGAQFKLANLGLRLEYERVSLNTGDPQMLTVGATWTF
jgi:opacity protein-like surface antigen